MPLLAGALRVAAARGLSRTLAVFSVAVALSIQPARFVLQRRLPLSTSSAPGRSCLGPGSMASGCGARLPHSKALTSPYPGSQVERSPVPRAKVGWQTEWEDYRPVEYTAGAVLAGPSWADPPIDEEGFAPKFNQRDGEVDRQSLHGLYLVENGRPSHPPPLLLAKCSLGSLLPAGCALEGVPEVGTDLRAQNPAGRTGLTGRGLLGRWGPNHAADPVVTRWKRDGRGQRVAHPVSGKHILQFIAIKRKDCGEWALPGGMVDPGEKISATLKREFGEEALNALQKSPEEKAELEQQLQKLFSQEHFVVYRGYVDDPRNTDNAWMETEAVNYHDETGESMEKLPLEAGDDAGLVQWVDISEELQLYASHSHFLQLVSEKLGAHWGQGPAAECQQ